MNTFLDFLNQATLEQLSETPGVSPPLSQRIIDARPFDSVESSMRVSGLGKNLLARMEERYHLTHPPEPETEPSEAEPVTNQLAIPDLDEPIQPYEPRTRETTRGPNFGQRLGRAFLNTLKFLFRLLIAVVIVGGIGAVIYFGIPYLQQTILQPLSTNTRQINQIATQQASDIAGLNQQITGLNSRLDTIEDSIETHTSSIQQLEEMQSFLDESITTSQETVTSRLKYQLGMTYSLELIARARLFLSQSNFGIAEDDLISARDKLVSLEESGVIETDIPLDDILNRLDLAIINLPAYPVIAASDLEIAWLLMIESTSFEP